MNALILTPIFLLTALGTSVDTARAPLPATMSSPVSRVPDPTRWTATGNFTQTSISSLDVQAAGSTMILHQRSAGSVTGSIDGTFEDDLRVIVRPNGRFTAVFTLVCDCVVDGRRGTLILQAADSGRLSGPTEGRFAGVAVITGATGELAGMQGVLRIEGTVDLVTGLSTYDYSGLVRTTW